MGFITARKRSFRRLCFYRCLSVHTGGACVVALGGGMRGCSGGVWFFRGACMVARGACVVFSWGMCGCSPGGQCVWFFSGGMRGFFWGVHGFFRGHAWFFPGGCAWFFRGVVGGVCVFFGAGTHGFFRGGVHRIRRDTVNERVVCILLECILVLIFSSVYAEKCFA